MVTRRKFIQAGTIAGAGLMLAPSGWVTRSAFAQSMLLDPMLQPKFVNPLPIASRVTAKGPGKAIKADIKESEQFLGLYGGDGDQLETRVWGYKYSNASTLRNGGNGIYPGATIVAERDTPISVLWRNKLKDFNLKKLAPWEAHLLPMDTSTHLASPQNLPKVGVPTVTHLHGGHTESASDGYPEAWFTKNFKETGPEFVKQTYRFDNDQESATLWYHDHALGITRLNMYAGLSGFYLLRDDTENQLGTDSVLPAEPYENEIMLQDRMFDANGELFMPFTNPELEPVNPLTGEPFLTLLPGPSIITEFFGDFILVNGMTWPVLEVEPRKYRFRILNSSDSRFYILKFDNAMSLLQVGTEQGLMHQATELTELMLAPSERADIVVDFSGLENADITLLNLGPDAPFKGLDAMGNVIGGSADPATTGQIMQFRVSKAFDHGVVEATVGAGTTLRPPLPIPVQSGATRQLVLFEGLDEYGRLEPMLGTLAEGSLAWFEAITETPNLNDVEVWEIYNTTEDAHPIHIHLIAFQTINRESFTGTVIQRTQLQHNGESGVGAELLAESVVLTGDARPPEPSERGWKDTVVALPGEVTRVITRPFDRPGLYVWHCHIISHEDHEMMRPFHVG